MNRILLLTKKNTQNQYQINSFSMDSWRAVICGLSCEPSFTVTAQAITGRETPQALPKADFDGTNT